MTIGAPNILLARHVPAYARGGQSRGVSESPACLFAERGRRSPSGDLGPVTGRRSESASHIGRSPKQP